MKKNRGIEDTHRESCLFDLVQERIHALAPLVESLYIELHAKLGEGDWEYRENGKLHGKLQGINSVASLRSDLRSDLRVAAAVIVARIAEDEGPTSPIRKLMKVEEEVDAGGLTALIHQFLKECG